MSEVFTDNYTYKLVRKIAEGGMGSVYEAILCGTEGFEKVVAVKTIKSHYTDDTEFVEMFIGEAKLVANLIHQNIVQIYQLGKVDDEYYIAMEYIKGITVEDLLDHLIDTDKAIPLDLGIFIISRICRGLEYAHNKKDSDGNLLGVVHRDVSPKNVMIDTEGEVKLTDFGIAKARTFMKDQEGSVIMGKPQYMSPEQAQYMSTDRRSDIFSLGIVMLELLTGSNIFADHDTASSMKNIVSKPIPDPSTLNTEIPETLSKIMLKMLDRDLDKRYQDATQLVYDLEYHMYHKGYGPTIATLRKYMKEVFPKLYNTKLDVNPDDLIVPA